MILPLGIRFVAGVVTAVSPCVLPVLPVVRAGGAAGGGPGRTRSCARRPAQLQVPSGGEGVQLHFWLVGDTVEVARVLYKPFGLLVSVLGALVAGAVFKRVWSAVAHEAEAPQATDADRGWHEVVAAAAAQGAVFGGVKALIDRAGASGFARITGAWPGQDRSRS